MINDISENFWSCIIPETTLRTTLSLPGFGLKRTVLLLRKGYRYYSGLRMSELQNFALKARYTACFTSEGQFHT